MIKLSRGFTLIELMVGVGILLLLVAGGVVSISRFASRDKVLAAKNEIVSGIKMARNYAMSAQKPAGFNDQLDSVAVTLDSITGVMTVYPVTVNIGIGISYFSKKIKSDDVMVSGMDFGGLVYSVPEGKLLQYVGNNPVNATTPVDINTTRQIVISPVDVPDGEERTVIIHSWGTFDEN